MKISLLILTVSITIGSFTSFFGQEPQDSKIAATTAEARKNDWWQKRHQQKLAALKKAEQVDLLWIGDSITHSWENGGKKVFQEYYGNRNAFNIGYSGDRTEHVIWRLQNGEVDGISPKLIVMMIGTNNTGHRQDRPENTAAGIKVILAELKKRLPESRVLLLGVFPRDRNKDGRLRKINLGINERIRNLADNETVFFLDIGFHFLDKDGTLPKSVMPDALHPNPAGYKIWAEALEPHIKKLMGEK